MQDRLFEQRLQDAEQWNEAAARQHRLCQTAFKRHARRLQQTSEQSGAAAEAGWKGLFASLAQLGSPLP